MIIGINKGNDESLCEERIKITWFCKWKQIRKVIMNIIKWILINFTFFMNLFSFCNLLLSLNLYICFWFNFKLEEGLRYIVKYLFSDCLLSNNVKKKYELLISYLNLIKFIFIYHSTIVTELFEGLCLC